MVRGRVLDQIDHRAAIFGAGAQAPVRSASRPAGCGRPNADLRIGRQESDRGGAETDHQQRCDQHGLAAIAIAEDAEDDAAQRPEHETDAEGQEGEQGAYDRIALRKEQFAEHQRRGGAVEEEVVPFQR